MGFFGDITGTSLKARWPSYANKEHLHPRERIRLFLATEASPNKIRADAVDWIDTTGDIFRFAEETDPRGELEMYAAAACARVAFQLIGSARVDLQAGDTQWKLELMFFRPNIQGAPEHIDMYLGRSGISYYPGFPKQHKISLPIEHRMSDTQRELKFRRYANKASGLISYIPLYDDEKPMVTPEAALSEPGWESKIT